MKQFLLFLFSTLTVFYGEAQVAPTNPCTKATIGNVDGTSFDINLTKATSGGGASRIIIAKKGSAVTAAPVDGNDYQHNTIFRSGFEIASEEFIVFDGASLSISITNLEPSTTYHFAVYEYNGTGSGIKYLSTPFVFTATTAVAPTTQATNITFSNVDASYATINWQAVTGGGERHLVVLKAGSPVDATVVPQDLQPYSPNSFFTSGYQFPTGNFVVYGDNGTSVTVSNLLANTTYYVAIYEYNGRIKPVYLSSNPITASFTTAPRPVKFVTGLFTMEPDGNTVNVRWDQNSGSGLGHLVVASEGSPVTGVPVDGQSYSSFSTSFGSGPTVAPGEFVLYKGTGYNIDARNLKSGTTYYFKVFEYANGSNGSVYATQGAPSVSVTMPSAPTVQASDLTISEVTNKSVKLSWANGDGKGRVILGKKGGAVNALPVNFTNYSSSTLFGNVAASGVIKGSDNSDNYVVYRSTSNATSVTITGLESATDYHFAIFEYNGISFPVFNTINPSRANQVTASRPSTGTSNLTFNPSYVEGNSLRMSWTNGNGAGRLVVAHKGSPVVNTPADHASYTAKPQFGTGAELRPGSGDYVVFDGTGSSSDFTVTGLEIGATYYFAVFEYAGAGSTLEYLTTAGSYATGFKTTYAAPTAGPTNLQIDNITNTSMRLTWSNASSAAGGGTARLVIAKEGAAVDVDPVNLTFYPNSSGFGSSKVEGTLNYALYYGNGNSVTVSSLKPGTTYHFRIVEANGNSGPVYYTAGALTGSQTTTATPTAPSTSFAPSALESNSVTIGWSSGAGTGAKRIVIAREGAAVSAVPANETTYNPDASFASNTPISAGEFVVFNGSSTSVAVSNLLPGRTYYFRVYEYNEVNGKPYYLTSLSLSGSITTKTKPLQQATNISFSALTSTSATISWTAVTADNYLVVAKQGQDVTFTPTDLVKYNTGSNFSSAPSVGNGHYAIYAGNNSSINVSGLTTGTTYSFAVFAFNGSNGPSYITSVSASNTGSVTTLGAPATQASVISFGIYENGTLQLSWSAGSGNRRLVLAKEGAAVNAQPVNNTDYLSSSVFKSGAQVGTGNYVVYNGSGTNTTISGLDNSKAYHFAIYEYNQFGPGSNSYLILNPATKELAAVTPLPVNWLSFSGTPIGNKVRLDWTTAQEVNNIGFEVERSSDGISFQKIGAVAPKSVTSYQYIDVQPLAGAAYYRIKQLDGDGQFSYSKTVKAQGNVAASIIRLLQNPVQGQLKLQSSQQLPGGQLQIVNAEGKVLLIQSLSAQLQIVDVQRLQKGVYYLQVFSKEGKREAVLPFIKN